MKASVVEDVNRIVVKEVANTEVVSDKAVKKVAYTGLSNQTNEAKIDRNE